MKRILIYRDEFHRVKMSIKEIKYNHQPFNNFNNFYR